MKSLSEYVIEMVMGVVMLAVILSVMIFFILIAVVGFFLFMYLKRKFDHLTKIEYAFPRLFDAPVQVQWVETWEYLLYKLEDITGLTFTVWPEQILAGSLIISIGTSLCIGTVLTLMNPGAGASWLVLCVGAGAIFGVVTAKSFAQPFASMFDGGSGGSLSDATGDGSLGTLLGIEDE